MATFRDPVSIVHTGNSLFGCECWREGHSPAYRSLGCRTGCMARLSHWTPCCQRQARPYSPAIDTPSSSWHWM